MLTGTLKYSPLNTLKVLNGAVHICWFSQTLSYGILLNRIQKGLTKTISSTLKSAPWETVVHWSKKWGLKMPHSSSKTIHIQDSGKGDIVIFSFNSAFKHGLKFKGPKLKSSEC